MSIEAAVKAVHRFGVVSTSTDQRSIVSSAVAQIIADLNFDVDSTPVNNKPHSLLTNGTDRVTLPGALATQSAQALGDIYSFTFTVDAIQ